jgi:hypothetical protein
MAIVYIDKCRYSIQEQKEVTVRYTGTYRPISSTAYILESDSCTPNCLHESVQSDGDIRTEKVK